MNKTTDNQNKREVILIDHTGARHIGEAYDAMKALRDAEEARPLAKPPEVALAEIAAMPQIEDRVLLPNWNREARGKEWG